MNYSHKYTASIIACLFTIISSLSLASCSNHPSSKSSDTTTNNVLRVDIGNEVSSLDPALAEDGVAFRVINDLFAGLVDFDQSNRPIPGMASHWQISRDKTTYTFFLRKNLKFSDGSPITANDFVYSWQRLVDPKTGSAYGFLLANVVNAKAILSGNMPANSLGVSAVDPLTFVVKLVHPMPEFLAYITTPGTFVVPQHTIAKYGDAWTTPEHMVTSGAYTLTTRVVDGYILATKNPNYYDSQNVHIQHVKYFPLVDDNVALATYATDGLDTTWQNVPIDKFAIIKQQFPNNLHVVQWERTDYLNFNMQLPKYANNPKLRQALAMAIDRTTLTHDVLKSGQIPLYSIVTPTIENGKYADVKYDWSTWPRAKQIAYAKQLYAEAGYNAQHPLTITLKYRNNDIYKKMCLAIATMWQQTLGVNVRLENMEWKSLLQSLHKGDYDIAQGGWGADFNSVNTYTGLYQCNNGNNNAHYCNKHYDDLINQAQRATSDNARTALYSAAITVANNDYPTIQIMEPAHQRLVSSRVANYNIGGNYLDNVQSKWLLLRSVHQQ